MSISGDLQETINSPSDQSAYMSKIVDDLIKNEAENEYEADIDQKVFAKGGRDKFATAKRVNRQVADQPDNTARCANRCAVRLEHQTKNAATDSRKQKYDRQVRTV